MPHTTIANRVRELHGWRHVAALGVVLLSSFVVGVVSVLPWSGPSNLSWWWPAVGFGSAAALMATPSLRPYVSVSYGLVVCVVAVIGERGAGVAVIGGLAAAIEVYVVATIATAHSEAPGIRNLRAAGRFMLGAVVGGIIGGLGVAAGVAASGGSFVATVGGVAASHASAILIITPLVLIARERRVTPWRVSLALTLLTLASTVLAFFPAWQEPLGFLPVPILMYAAFTQSMRVTYVQLVLTLVVVSALTAAGGGAFANSSGAIRVVSLLQIYAITLAVTVLFVAAAQAHQRRLIDQREGTRRLLNEGFARARSGFAILSEEADGALAVLEINPMATAVLASELTTTSKSRTVVRSQGTLRSFAKMLAPGRSDTTAWPVEEGDDALFRITVEALGRSDYGKFYLLYIEDLSPLREAEAVMAARLEKEREVVATLKAVSQQKDDFVASVSHELRTPLTSISGYAEELAELVDTPLERDYIAVILRNSERLLELVSNVLAAARRQRRDADVEAEPIVLCEVIEQCLLDIRYSIVSREIVTEVECSSTLRVMAYPGDLTRVITNLLTNAVKFSPRGGRLSIAATHADGTVVVTVQDDGPGIDPADRERLFEPFYRAPKTIHDGVAGTGLGLTITRDLLAGMNATIDLDNAPAGGAVAELRFPAVPADAVRSGEAPQSA